MKIISVIKIRKLIIIYNLFEENMKNEDEREKFIPYYALVFKLIKIFFSLKTRQKLYLIIKDINY